MSCFTDGNNKVSCFKDSLASTPCGDIYQAEADYFARCLLMPEAKFRELERSTFYIVDTSIEKHLQVDCGTRLQGIYENRINGYKENKIECVEVLGNIHENVDLLIKEQDEAKKLHNQRLCRSLRRYH